MALGVLAAVLALLAGPASFWLEAGLWTRVGRLGLVIAAGGAAYFGALWLLGFRLADFSRREADRETAGSPPPERGQPSQLQPSLLPVRAARASMQSA